MKHFFRESLPYVHGKSKTSLCLLVALLSLFFSINSVSAQSGAFTCPADIVQNSDPGQCGAIVNFAATSSDQTLTVVYNHPPGVMYPVGITNVIARAYDATWNIVSTCSFNVTVVNTGLPTISVQDISAPNGKDSCGAVVHFATPSVSVNCPFQNRTFSYTGAAQSFTVPAGVSSINVDVFGAGGGMAAASDGNTYGYPGLGGRVEATIAVTPGEVLSLTVGGVGQNGSATTFGEGGFNGGASGGAYSTLYTGGGGGGASDIRTGSATLNNRTVVAGGGGASGYFGAGGNGGDLIGAEGYGAGTNAGGGTQTQGGAGGNYLSTFYAADGTFGKGGSAAAGSQGGGGGGGWYGGGGGAFGDGGGGSSYTSSSSTNVVHTQGYQEGNGTIVLSWSQPPVLTQTAGLASGAVYPVGTTTNTFTATDAVGNTSQTSFNVVITDTQSAVLTAPANVAVNTNATSCEATNIALGNPTAIDNCGVASVTNDAPSSFNVGTTTITWTATDVHGNTSTATQTVTVTDNQNPTLAAPSNMTVSADNGSCNATNVALRTPTTADNCGVLSVTNNAPSSFIVGATNVTWTVTDVHGNIATAIQTVTVTDNQNPTITAPSNVTVSVNNVSCTATNVAIGTPATADNCGVASVTNNAPSSFIVGATNVTWTVTDVHGNIATAIQTVTVTDNQKPTIIAPSNVSVSLDNGSCTATNVALGTPAIADNCGVASVTNNAPSSFIVGATNVTWTVTDVHGNIATAIQTVTVTDNQKPTIIAPSNVSVSLDNGSCTATNVALGTPATADNCAVANVTNNAPASFAFGATNVTWTVTDVHGNVATAIQTVTVTDNQNPTITAPFNVSLSVDNGSCVASNVALGTPLTADNCTVATVTNDAPASYHVGTNIVNWTVTDANGNSSTASQIITVTDNQNPTITAPADIVIVLSNGATTASNVNLGTPATADNCSVSSINNNAPSSYPVGTTTVTWTVTDAHGNTASATQRVIVSQAASQVPTITCPPATKYCFVSSTNSYAVAQLIVTNNSSVKSIVYTVKNAAGATLRSGTGTNASGTFATGTNTISWTVTDNSNHVIAGTTSVVIWELPSIAIAVSTPDAFCNSIVLTASSTATNVVSYEWSYNTGAFTNAQSIQLNNSNADGIYKAYVTNVNGCKNATPATYNYVKQSLLSNYTIVAIKEIELAASNTVQTGSVGVLYSNGSASFDKNFTLASAGTVVRAPYISYQNPANIANKVYSAALFSAYPTMLFNTSSASSLPVYTVNTNVTVTLSGQYKTLTIKKGANVTLTNNLFGDISMESGAKLTFSNAQVKIASMNVQAGDNTTYTTVKFSQNTDMLVSNRVDIGERSLVNPDNKKVTFYMGDLKADEEKFTVKSGDTKLIANVYMPNGKMTVKSGDKKKTCYLTGIFMAEEVDGQGENVIWNSYNCGYAMTAPARDAVSYNNIVVTEEIALNGVKVYPNPTSGRFSIELNNVKSTKAEIVVMTVNGLVIEKRDVELAGTKQLLDFNIEKNAAGVYLVQISTNEGVKTVKVIKGK